MALEVLLRRMPKPDAALGEEMPCMWGGAPAKARWSMWKETMRISAFRPGISYEELSSRNNEWTSQIELDIHRTFPNRRSFDSQQQQRLLRVLNAYASLDTKVGYCQGMNYVAGLLLIISECEREAFDVLVCLMQRYGLAGFFQECFPLAQLCTETCEHLMSENAPVLKMHLKEQGIDSSLYLHEWFLTLFVNCLPLPTVVAIWDAIMIEGLLIIVPVAICILQALEGCSLTLRSEDVLTFFKAIRDSDPHAPGPLHASNLMARAYKLHVPHEIMAELRRSFDNTARDSEDSPGAGRPKLSQESPTGGGPTDNGEALDDQIPAMDVKPVTPRPDDEKDQCQNGRPTSLTSVASPSRRRAALCSRFSLDDGFPASPIQRRPPATATA
jgi:hypothetical protein